MRKNRPRLRKSRPRLRKNRPRLRKNRPKLRKNRATLTAAPVATLTASLTKRDTSTGERASMRNRVDALFPFLVTDVSQKLLFM